MAVERTKIDWEKVEAYYRAGKLSLREIAKIYGCSDTAIRKRAKTEGWSRDLSEKIEKEVRSKLVRAEVRTSASDREIVEAVAEVSANIIIGHRKDLADLQEIEKDLLLKLKGIDGKGPTKLFITQYQGQIVEKVVGMTVAEEASTLLALTNARVKRMERECKAYGIVDGTVPQGSTQNSNPYEGLPGHLLDMIHGVESES